MGKYSDMVLGGFPGATAEQPRSWSSELLGVDARQRASLQPQQPQQEGWGEWIVNSVRGRQDPAYADTQSVFSQYRDELSNPTGLAALAGASDAQMGDVIRKQLGGRVVRTEKDRLGNEVIVTRGPDGSERRGYVNVPGLDLEDVARGVRGALPYVATGGAAGVAARGAGLGLNMLAQGGTAAVTSAAGDVAQIPLGSEQGIEGGKAAAIGAFGAAGPAVGSAAGYLWKRFVIVPGLIDKATGKLTAKGAAAARQAGLDPADLDADFSQQFAKGFADSRDAKQAATRAGVDAYQIPVTRGQVSKDPYLLTQEEGMRRRLFGQSAQDTMLGFDQRQADAIRSAALGPAKDLGEQLAATPSVASRIAPNRSPGAYEFDRNPGPLGDDIGAAIRSSKDAAKAEEGLMWDDGVRTLSATPEALKLLRPMVQARLVSEGVSDMTPALEMATKIVGDFADGNLPVVQSGGISLRATKSVDDMRRRLGRLVGGATDPTDKRNVGLVYDAFNDWIGQSAKEKLLAGDPEAVMRLVQARAFTKSVRELFGNKAAGTRLSKIFDGKADSGEAVIDSLFGSHGSKGVNQGTVTTLRTIKAALDRFSPEGAEAAWNDIRLAYWTRLVTGKNGDMLGPQAIANNIKNALSRQSTVVNTLYDRAQLAEIRKFLFAVEAAAYKPPNASGSGYTAASFVKDWALRFLDSLGVGGATRAAVSMSGIDRAFGAGAAQRAVSGVVRQPSPNLAPATATIGQQYNRQSR